MPQQNSDERKGDGLRNPLPNFTHSNNLITPASAASIDEWSYATQELLDALPRVWTRGLLYFLVVFAAISLPWTMLAKVDETSSARGRLEPKGKSFKLEAPVAGTVTKVLVNEGQLVKEGQPLLELESEQIRSDLQPVQIKLQGQLNRLAQLEKRVLRAPVSGTIFQLPIQRPGAVVRPSTLIAEIAPAGSPLVLWAQIATQKSGSLREGMPVKINFDAYSFQDYGVLEGKLSQISPTSKVTETAQGALTTYDLEISLKQTCIQTSNECIALNPGQTATAEVIVRQRRVIDFILDPFKKLQKGGLEL